MEFRTTIISPDQPASALIGCERTDMTLYSQFKRSRVILIYIQQDGTLQFILSGNCSAYFGWYHRAQTTVSATSGICQTVPATYRYSGR